MLNILGGQPERKLCIPGVTQLGYAGEVLDGFGAVGDGAHARHEHVGAAGMLERTALAAAVLRALTTEPA